MTDLRRRLTLADEPQEARVFLFISAFGIVVGIVYWFVSYEHAGTVLLLGFGGATGLFGWRLATTPSARIVRRLAQQHGGEQVPREDTPGGGTADVDRPYVDESGRLPDETAAPFAVGLGLSIAATGTIFGIAPLAVGLLPLAWGAWTWLTAARDELQAEELDDVAFPGGREAGA